MRRDERDAAPVPGPRAGIYVGGVPLGRSALCAHGAAVSEGVAPDELVGGADVSAARATVERGLAAFLEVLCAMRYVRDHERAAGPDDALSMFTPPMRRLVDGTLDGE